MKKTEIKVHCAHNKIVEITTLVPNPRNPNKHPETQIELLAKIIRNQGWRNAIVVSKRSGFVVKGHARLAAALLLKVPTAPVDVQDYENEAAEWADMIADNRLAELAEMDHEALNVLIAELDGKIDMDLTGLDKAQIEIMSEDTEQCSSDPTKEWDDMPEFDNPAKGEHSLIVHFKSRMRLVEFSKLIGGTVTDKTKFLWFPVTDKTYNDDGTPTDDL